MRLPIFRKNEFDFRPRIQAQIKKSNQSFVGEILAKSEWIYAASANQDWRLSSRDPFYGFMKLDGSQGVMKSDAIGAGEVKGIGENPTAQTILESVRADMRSPSIRINHLTGNLRIFINFKNAD